MLQPQAKVDYARHALGFSRSSQERATERHRFLVVFELDIKVPFGQFEND